MIDVATPNDSNIGKKEHERLEKYQRLRDELEKMCRVKETMVIVVIGAFSAVTPKVGKQQIPGTTATISVKKSTILGTHSYPFVHQTHIPLSTCTYRYSQFESPAGGTNCLIMGKLLLFFFLHFCTVKFPLL